MDFMDEFEEFEIKINLKYKNKPNLNFIFEVKGDLPTTSAKIIIEDLISKLNFHIK